MAAKCIRKQGRLPKMCKPFAHRIYSSYQYTTLYMSNPTRRPNRPRGAQDPRQQLNERVQNHFGDTREALTMVCKKTVPTPHAQRWKCTIKLRNVPMGEIESEEFPNQPLAKKDAAEKALKWLEDNGYPGTSN